MTGKKILSIIGLIFILALPAAFALSGTTTAYRATPTQTTSVQSYRPQTTTSYYGYTQPYSYGSPYIVRTEKKCGDCSRGLTPECQTLYTTSYYSDGTSKTTTEKISGYFYCINGHFESFAWITWNECKNNGYSVAYRKFFSPWGWTMMQTTSIDYCQYSCNWSTGKCNPAWTRPANPEYKLECRGNRVVKAYSDGCVITIETCGSGYVCDPVGFRCMQEKTPEYTPQPVYREPAGIQAYRAPETPTTTTAYQQYFYSCIGNYSVKTLQDKSTVVKQTFCYNGCNRATGQCN
ncbi:MAG: hypothetical protein QXK06_05140 [Candidatus Diapherotrites archaeon]